MEKAGENSGNSSNVEQINLRLSLNGGSSENVASNVTVLETQQPSIQVSGRIHKGILMRSFLLSMPRVSTRGNESNGKKTDGFLYSCRKREDVKIICVCHGYVLSPAEFVKHAGGGDVENPLRHIMMGN